MKELINVKHPRINVSELHERIKRKDKPIRRSTHIGNQPAHELFLQCNMPAGIEIIAVDSIRAGDQYSSPRTLRLESGDIPLASSKSASLLVGAAVVRDDIDEHLGSVVLACIPIAGERLQDFHARALAGLNPSNMPVNMSELFGRQPDLLTAVMAAARDSGEEMRQVSEDGTRTEPLTGQIEDVGIFGLSDVSQSSMGALPSLNTMMAMDVLLSTSQGSDSTLHLAGPDMVQYTRDPERMNRVGDIFGKAAATIGLAIRSHHFLEVADITGLGRLVPAAEFVSQHELLRAREFDVAALGRICASAEA